MCNVKDDLRRWPSITDGTHLSAMHWPVKELWQKPAMRQLYWRDQAGGDVGRWSGYAASGKRIAMKFDGSLLIAMHHRSK